jgi:hypothetical protein
VAQEAPGTGAADRDRAQGRPRPNGPLRRGKSSPPIAPHRRHPYAAG